MKLLIGFRRQNCGKKYFFEGLKNQFFYQKVVDQSSTLVLGSRMASFFIWEVSTCWFIEPWSWVLSLLSYSSQNYLISIYTVFSGKLQKAAAAITYTFTISILVPIYLPIGTATSKHLISANIYNDVLEILTTATFVYVYIYPYTVYIYIYISFQIILKRTFWVQFGRILI